MGIMTLVQRRLFTILLSITLALALVQLLDLHGGQQVQATMDLSSNSQAQTISPNCSPCYSFYGSNHSWMYTATNEWYQHHGNWCGIANIRAIQVYDLIYCNGTSRHWV